jgi:serine protease inhibitor
MLGGVTGWKNSRVGFFICLCVLLAACNSGSGGSAGQPGINQSTEKQSVQQTLDGTADAGQPDNSQADETTIETYAAGQPLPVDDVTQAELDALKLSDIKRALNLGASDENSVRFPADLISAISMLAAGAANQTLTSLYQWLYNPEIADGRLHTVMNAWETAYDSNLNDVRSWHRGFWGQTNYLFKTSYLDQITQSYGAEVNGLDFLEYPDESAQEIRDWLAGISQDLPGDVISGSVSNKTRVVSVTADLIDAQWSSNGVTVSSLAGGRFETIDESMYAMSMVYFAGALNYFETEQYHAVQLPTQDDSLVLVVLMPNRGEFKAVEALLTPEFIAGLEDSFALATTEFYLPEFELSVSRDIPLDYPVDTEGVADFTAVNGVGSLYAKSFRQDGNITVSASGMTSSSITSFQLDATEEGPKHKSVGSTLTVTQAGGAASVPCYDPAQTKAQPCVFCVVVNQTGTNMVYGDFVTPGDNDTAVAVEPDWLGSTLYGCDTPPSSSLNQFSLDAGSNTAPIGWDTTTAPAGWGSLTTDGSGVPF